MAGEQGGQGVEHHQVQRLLAMRSFQVGDSGVRAGSSVLNALPPVPW